MISSIMRYKMYKCISQPVFTIDSVQHAQTSQSKISISFASRVEPANSNHCNHRNHSQPLLGAGFQIRHQVNSDRALGC